MLLTYVLFLVGFPVLIFSADALVRGAGGIAKKFGVSDLVIGLTVVAFGTSAPELAVNIIASWQGNTGVTLGNIFGSNIANIWLILGVAALIYPLSVQQGLLQREIPYALMTVAVLGVLANDILWRTTAAPALGRVDGLLLMGLFVLFMVFITRDVLAEQQEAKLIAEGSGPEGMGVTQSGAVAEALEEAPPVTHLGKAVTMVVGGITGLVLGGDWLVDGAVALAHKFGASEKLIGLTIIAIGTSLPELATSCMAAFRKNTDIAVGNVVGSNIFNTVLVLGVSALIRPLTFDANANIDLAVNLAATVALFVVWFSHKRDIGRFLGALFLCCYAVYITVSVMRG